MQSCPATSNIYVVVFHYDQVASCIFGFVHGLRACLTERLYCTVQSRNVCEYSVNKWKKMNMDNVFYKQVFSSAFFSFWFYPCPPKANFFLTKYVCWIISGRLFFLFLKNSEVKGLLTSLWNPSNNVPYVLLRKKTSSSFHSYADICSVPFYLGIVWCFVHDKCFHLSNSEWYEGFL